MLRAQPVRFFFVLGGGGVRVQVISPRTLPPPLPSFLIYRALTGRQFLWFPCGIVRGALAALGMNATVQADINDLPGAVFQIKTLPSKP